jgi:hypothetical protein
VNCTSSNGWPRATGSSRTSTSLVPGRTDTSRWPPIDRMTSGREGGCHFAVSRLTRRPATDRARAVTDATSWRPGSVGPCCRRSVRTAHPLARSTSSPMPRVFNTPKGGIGSRRLNCRDDAGVLMKTEPLRPPPKARYLRRHRLRCQSGSVSVAHISRSSSREFSVGGWALKSPEDAKRRTCDRPNRPSPRPPSRPL